MDASIKSSEDTILAANKSAVENIRKDNFDHAMFFLNQALLTAKSMKDCPKKFNLLAMTYNNLGCYLKRSNNLAQALEHFLKASELSRTYDDNIANLTCSHLNISKIYSEQGDHEKSLRHALKSLFLLRHNFAEKQTLVSSLIIAYQTVGLEYRFLHQDMDSLECFETGLALSLKHLGKKHEVTIALKKSFSEATGRWGNSGGSGDKSLHKDPRGSQKSSCKSYAGDNDSAAIKRRSVEGREKGKRGCSAIATKRRMVRERPRKNAGSTRNRQIVKVRSRVFEMSGVERERERETMVKTGRRYTKGDKDAVILIQRWWKERCRGTIEARRLASVRVQRWWRAILLARYAEKMRIRNRINKKLVVNKPRYSKQVHTFASGEETKKIINEKERALVYGSTKLLAETSKKPMPEYARKGPNTIGESNKTIDSDSSSKYTENPRVSREKLPMIKEKSNPDKSEIRQDNKLPTFPTKINCNSKNGKSTEEIPYMNNNKTDLPKKLNDVNYRRPDSRDDSTKKSNTNSRQSSPVVLNTNGKASAPSKVVSKISPKPVLDKDSNPHKSNTPNFNQKDEDAVALHKLPTATAKRSFLSNRRNDITHQMNSLVKIQSFARMVVPRIKFLRFRKSCVKIQKAFKGHLIRKLYQAIRDAVIFIQYMYRKTKERLR